MESSGNIMCAGPPMPAPVEEKSASKIDGKAISAQIRQELKEQVDELKGAKGVTPGLAVVLVGSRTDSATYVRMKKRAAEEAGIYSVTLEFDDDVTQEKLFETIDDLAARKDIHGILVQIPLPDHIDEHAVFKRIPVHKDVDGFCAENIGNLALKGGDPPLALPCTPAGCVQLLQRSGVDCSGKHAVIIGRSNIVGMPLVHLLLSLDATVTVVHSRTPDIKAKVQMGDIVIAAVGRTEMVRGDWIKPGAVVLDVGINSVPDKTRKSGYRLVGDVCFAEASKVASQITPVPGGVGPMTIAMLMWNTVNLTRVALGMPRMHLRQSVSSEPTA
mmetsp:Transcript_21671/g.38270  ORF Transcript_21671/g.38270 Transcript_21671/m.38270 type:complete len:330 (+) Transcript_21671:70-1059(+)